MIYGDHIFQLADNGVLEAIDKNTGHTFWKRRLGSLSASTPAVVGGTVYATVLARPDGVKKGAGLRARLHPPGPCAGRARCRARASPRRWSTTAWSSSGPRTGPSTRSTSTTARRSGPTTPRARSRPARRSPAGCSTSATTPATSRRSPSAPAGRCGSRAPKARCSAAARSTRPPPSIYGRVYLGNTDGRIYAYDASTGRLDWAVQTGDYVYSSPAVTNAPGLGPTIYLGSYSGTFYALNARSGAVSWQFDTHGRISGSATIIGRIVYFSDLGEHRTYGLGISTGRVLFALGTAPSTRRSATARTSISRATRALCVRAHRPSGLNPASGRARGGP